MAQYRVAQRIAYTRLDRPMSAPISDRARRFPGRQDWKAEYAELSARDRRTRLAPAGLERLGIAAYLAGDESGSIDVHTRAHNAALDNRDTRQATRSAFWIAFVRSYTLRSMRTHRPPAYDLKPESFLRLARRWRGGA